MYLTNYTSIYILHLFSFSLSPPEIRGEVHHISLVGDRTLLALDRNKLPLPPLLSRYFMWGFPDRSTRVASAEGDKVGGDTVEPLSIGAEESVLISEVSSFQRLKCMQEWYLGQEKVSC